MRARLASRLKPLLFALLLMSTITTATAEETETFADIFGNLIFGVSIVTDFLHASSMLLGVGFTIYAFVSYRNHRLNPKMVPLDKPLLYLFLGVVLTAVPFLGQIVQRTTGEAHVHKHHQHRATANRSHSHYHYDHDIDEPLDE